MEIIYVEKCQPFGRSPTIRKVSDGESFIKQSYLLDGRETSGMVTTNVPQNYQRQVIN